MGPDRVERIRKRVMYVFAAIAFIFLMFGNMIGFSIFTALVVLLGFDREFSLKNDVDN